MSAENRLASIAGPRRWRAKFGRFRPQSDRNPIGIPLDSTSDRTSAGFWPDYGRKRSESRRQWPPARDASTAPDSACALILGNADGGVAENEGRVESGRRRAVGTSRTGSFSTPPSVIRSATGRGIAESGMAENKGQVESGRARVRHARVVHRACVTKSYIYNHIIS